jgi:hypothetical protein
MGMGGFPVAGGGGFASQGGEAGMTLELRAEATLAAQPAAPIDRESSLQNKRHEAAHGRAVVYSYRIGLGL